jgi:hypothetical protein
LSSVDALEFDFPSDFVNATFRTEAPVPKLADADGPFPFTQRGSIKFTLHIPQRLQSELRPWPRSASTYTELFLVVVKYSFAMPVAMVHPVDPSGEADPSEAVVIVREFLKRELASPGSAVTFESLGPTPSHADVYLESTEEIAEDLDFERASHSLAGYDRFGYNYDASKVSTTSDAAVAFFEAAETELDLYYRIAQSESVNIHAWVRVSNSVAALAAAQRLTGVKGFFTKAVQMHRRLTTAFIELTEFEMDGIAATSEFERDFSRIYGPGSVRYLKELVDGMLRTREQHPTAQMSSLLQQFEDRRLTDRELVTGLIGAAVGAAAALIAG